MMREESTSSPPPPSPHAAASSTPTQRRVLGDVSNAPPSPPATGNLNGAKQRGHKPGQKNFGKFSGLPARAKSTRRRSAPVPVDHANAALVPSFPRLARPVVAAARPGAASVRAVAAALSLDEPCTICAFGRRRGRGARFVEDPQGAPRQRLGEGRHDKGLECQGSSDAPQLVYCLSRPDLRQRVRGGPPRDEAALHFLCLPEDHGNDFNV